MRFQFCPKIYAAFTVWLYSVIDFLKELPKGKFPVKFSLTNYVTNLYSTLAMIQALC